MRDFEKNYSYIPSHAWLEPSLFQNNITHLDFSGLQQLNDFVFGVFHFSNIVMTNLSFLDCSGCNHITDTGMRNGDNLYCKRQLSLLGKNQVKNLAFFVMMNYLPID